jgi:hypothetical protein
MDSMWVQVGVGLLAVVSPFVGAALGAFVLACTPLRSLPATVARRR